MPDLIQGSNIQPEISKSIVKDMDLPPKTLLSPLKEALCVAVIWVFIVGVPVWVRYYFYLFPFWVTAGFFLESRWRKKHNVSFLPRKFTNWLLSFWFWEIFVRRCHIGSKNALQLRGLAGMSLMIGGLFFLLWFYTPHPIELGEMRVVSGTLEGWKLQSPIAKGGCGDIITLRLEDGRSENFFKGKATEDFYRQMEGKELTIWVQSSTNNMLPNCRKFESLVQMQHGVRIIGLPYDKARYEKTEWFVYKTAKFFVWTGLFFLLLVWLINRRKNAKIDEIKQS